MKASRAQPSEASDRGSTARHVNVRNALDVDICIS
jgi:hypothetical protein